MNSESRVTSTRYIWVASTIAMLITNSNIFFSDMGPTIINVVMVAIIMVATAGSTAAIWTAPMASGEADTTDNKLKRGERVKRLIDLLDDDELYELRQRLSKKPIMDDDNFVMLGDDGELYHNQIKTS